MGCKILILLVAWLTALFVSATERAPCPSGTVALDVIEAADVERLMDKLNCTGRGDFNITWYSSLQIGQRIDVSDKKNLTVTGSEFPTISGALDDDNDAGGNVTTGTATGIFSVSGGSILRLNHLALEGGDAFSGGAVSVYSSVLVAVGSTFANNHASKNGGERTFQDMCKLSAVIDAILLAELLQAPKLQYI